MASPKELKAHVRQLALKRIEQMIKENKRIESDYEIVKQIRNLDVYRQAKKVFSYHPFEIEPVITELFKDEQKTFYFPKISGDELSCGTGRLVRGKFGIYEPVSTENISEFDIMLIPGIAFDVNFYRIGRGLGYFDKYLKKVRGIKVGICYDVQIFNNVPHEEHDVRMDMIVSEKRTLMQNKSR